jgi:hypothetical protein
MVTALTGVQAFKADIAKSAKKRGASFTIQFVTAGVSK